MKERLQKILSQAGICSRRQAEAYILQGQVTVDGVVITELGTRADPLKQQILFNGSPVRPARKKIYLLLNKPKGYLTTLKDPQGRPIVTSLLKEVGQRLFPVGRLDLDTEGALLLTNDGELTQRVLHPSFEITRTYQAVIKGQITKDQITSLEKGIELDGQMTWPATLSIVKKSQPGTTTLRIIIHEGRKRQVRRMFEAVGHPVLHLKRLAYGNLKLGSLPTGKYRFLNKNDLDQLFAENFLYKK